MRQPTNGLQTAWKGVDRSQSCGFFDRVLTALHAGQRALAAYESRYAVDADCGGEGPIAVEAYVHCGVFVPGPAGEICRPFAVGSKRPENPVFADVAVVNESLAAAPDEAGGRLLCRGPWSLSPCAGLRSAPLGVLYCNPVPSGAMFSTGVSGWASTRRPSKRRSSVSARRIRRSLPIKQNRQT